MVQIVESKLDEEWRLGMSALDFDLIRHDEEF
jgi:hypothetical protein